MKREIKFRAWDGVNNRMKNWDYILNDFGLQDLFLDVRWTAMQYTGIRDRNGNEIYEGDIVREDKNTDGTWRSLAVIEFYEGSFGSRNEHDRFRIPAVFAGPAIEGMNLNYYEIIGNIYTTPELLNTPPVNP